MSNARENQLRLTSVKTFGATGDGVANDSAAIQAAIDTAEDGAGQFHGRVVLFRQW